MQMSEPQASFEWSTDFDNAIDRASAEQRIDGGYWDIFHHYHETPREVRKKLARGNGMGHRGPETIDREREKRFREHLTRAGAGNPRARRSRPFGACHGAWNRRGQRDSGSGSVTKTAAPQAGECAFESLAFSHRVSSAANTGWRAGSRFRRTHPWVITGSKLRLVKQPPSRLIIVCPERAYLPERLADMRPQRGLQRYALRSALGPQLGLRRFHGSARARQVGA